jgi:hypothetical protein
MRRLAFLLVGFFLTGPFTMSSDAWAWGDQGHKVICEIAFRLVQPNTRAEIQKLISTETCREIRMDSTPRPAQARRLAS